LRSTSDLRCSTKLDLEKIYVVQKVHDKTGLGYIESLPSSVSKDTGSPKENVEQSKKSESKTDNVKNAKDNRRKYNHTYQYKYSNRKIGTITTIREIGIHLILIGQIKFILEILMVGVMN
jgi:hypothetical protein